MIKNIRGTIAFTNTKSESFYRPCINLIIHCDDKNDTDTELNIKFSNKSGKLMAIINNLYIVCLRLFSPKTRHYINWWLKTVEEHEGYYLLTTYIFQDGSNVSEKKWIFDFLKYS